MMSLRSLHMRKLALTLCLAGVVAVVVPAQESG